MWLAPGPERAVVIGCTDAAAVLPSAAAFADVDDRLAQREHVQLAVADAATAQLGRADPLGQVGRLRGVGVLPGDR